MLLMCVCACRSMLTKLLTVCLLASTSAFAPPASITNRAVAKPLVTSRGPTIEMMPTWQKQGKLFQIPHQSTGENPDTEVLNFVYVFGFTAVVMGFLMILAVGGAEMR